MLEKLYKIKILWNFHGQPMLRRLPIMMFSSQKVISSLGEDIDSLLKYWKDRHNVHHKKDRLSYKKEAHRSYFGDGRIWKPTDNSKIEHAKKVKCELYKNRILRYRYEIGKKVDNKEQS